MFHLTEFMFLRSRRRFFVLLLIISIVSLIYLVKRRNSRKAHETFIRTKQKACSENTHIYRYALIIDAGSSGSRVHGYKFDICSKTSSKPINEFFSSVRPGLSSFFDKSPIDAANSLRPLLDASLTKVPTALHYCTPIQLRATAGMRLINPSVANNILKSVRELFMKDYPFPTIGTKVNSEDAFSIMEGKDEGLLAWVSLMVLLPQSISSEGVASIDLGGASAQLVFEIDKSATESNNILQSNYFARIEVNEKEHLVYQNSFLGYGLHEVLKRLHEHEDNGKCFSDKRTMLTCMDLVKEAIFKTNNPLDKCSKGGLCLIENVYQPPLPPKIRIIAYSYFYDLLKEYSIIVKNKPITRQNILSLLLEACSLKKLLELSSDKLDEGLKPKSACAAITYISLLLEHFGIPDDREIIIARNFEELELGWWLGAALKLANVYSKELKSLKNEVSCWFPKLQ